MENRCKNRALIDVAGERKNITKDVCERDLPPKSWQPALSESYVFLRLNVMLWKSCFFVPTKVLTKRLSKNGPNIYLKYNFYKKKRMRKSSKKTRETNIDKTSKNDAKMEPKPMQKQLKTYEKRGRKTRSKTMWKKNEVEPRGSGRGGFTRP